jgi:transcriptional regulator with XRE-family HTH domain
MARRHHAIDRQLGGRVRFARIEKKISQTLLGERLGISFQQVQKYELGKDRISASQLVGIARILGKDISFFFEEIETDDDLAGAEPAAAVAQERTSRSDKVYDIKIIRLLHAIENEKLKARLYHLMEAIVGARRQAAHFDPRLALVAADEDGGRHTAR